MLGICIVYLFPDEGSRIFLDVSLSAFRAFTRGPYRIFACGVRLSVEDDKRIREHGIELADIPPCDRSGGYEHAYYLDHLVDMAFAAGCDRVATFDLDSWPVAPDWDAPFTTLLSEEWPVAAIVRTELKDNFPLGAFTIIDRGFWKIGASSFSAGQRASFEEGIVRQISRPPETGAGILAQLLCEGRGFYELHRSNHWLPHPIMCAVYGGLVFHFGGGSRQPQFITDRQTYDLDGLPLRTEFGRAMNSAVRQYFLEALRVSPRDVIGALSSVMGADGLRKIEDAGRLRLEPA